MDSKISEITFFIVFSSLILLVLAGLVINLLLISRNKRLKHQSQLLEVKSNYEKELMKTQVEVAENTLNDIARDLHDDVGQMLTFSIIKMNSINVKDDKHLENNLIEVRESVRQSLQTIRELSKSFSQDYLSNFGIHYSLQRLFDRLNRQKIISAKLDFPDTIKFKLQSSELFTFRIIQELVTNTVKHSEAREVWLQVSENENSIILKYHDNGIGISEETLARIRDHDSLGFSNIQKRIILMNGHFEIKSNLPTGTAVEISIPNE